MDLTFPLNLRNPKEKVYRSSGYFLLMNLAASLA